MKTEFWVEYELFDTTALEYAQKSTDSNASFADIKRMNENNEMPDYATLEHNFFVLDGSMEAFPDGPDGFAYFSSVQSDENGSFPDKTQINIKFNENHTSYGLTLYFLDDYPLEVEIEWRDLLGILQSRKRFFPTDRIYFCKNPMEDFGRVTIRFVNGLPYHNVKLQYVEYGTKIIWNSDNIKSGKLVGGTDLTGDKIVSDKLTFDFVDDTNEFNPGNAAGLHKLFQRSQKMRPYEIVNGNTITLGVFFLDNFSVSKNLCRLSAIDYKGMLANTDYIDGNVYNGTKAGEVIDDIMASAGIEFYNYSIDEETYNTPLYGYLKIQTCQKALREILFACGSVICTARREFMAIAKADYSAVGTIGRDRKFSTAVSQDKYVSDISVKYESLEPDEKISEIARGKYGAGSHLIKFASPARELTTNVGVITKQMPNYVVLQIDGAEVTDVVISGKKYVSTVLYASASVEHIKAGEVRNARNYTGSLLDYNRAKAVAERILGYCQNQLVIKTKHLAGEEHAGAWVEIENEKVAYADFVCAIESETIDLSGGFISTAKCRGDYKYTTEHFYSGKELYADNDTNAII